MKCSTTLASLQTNPYLKALESSKRYANFTQTIRSNTGSHTFAVEDYLGRDYIKVHFSERLLISLIINITLQYVRGLRLMTQLVVTYNQFDIYSLERSEEIFLESLGDYEQPHMLLAIAANLHWQHFQKYLWKSE